MPLDVISSPKLFQSTHPRGVRRRYHKAYDRYRRISIHAPARGATKPFISFVSPFSNFNPRTREGCDMGLSCGVTIHRTFQSTHPRGVRLGFSDLLFRHRFISIHAPARGATIYNQHKLIHQYISIHAPARGATSIKLNLIKLRRISIHAPARGATFPSRFRKPKRSDFNPRTREGCDVSEFVHSLESYTISIHAPARGATVFLSPFVGFFHTAKSFLSVLSLFSRFFVRQLRHFSVQLPFSKH